MRNCHFDLIDQIHEYISKIISKLDAIFHEIQIANHQLENILTLPK